MDGLNLIGKAARLKFENENYVLNGWSIREFRLATPLNEFQSQVLVHLYYTLEEDRRNPPGPPPLAPPPFPPPSPPQNPLPSPSQNPPQSPPPNPPSSPPPNQHQPAPNQHAEEVDKINKDDLNLEGNFDLEGIFDFGDNFDIGDDFFVFDDDLIP